MCTGPPQERYLDASVTASAARIGLSGLLGRPFAGALALPAAVGAPNQPAGQTAHRAGGDRMDHLQDARSEASHSDAEGSVSTTGGRCETSAYLSSIGTSCRAGNRKTARNHPYRSPAQPHTPPQRRRQQSSIPWKEEEDQRLAKLVAFHNPKGINWTEVARALTSDGHIDRSGKQCRER